MRSININIEDIIVNNEWNVRGKHLSGPRIKEYAEHIEMVPPLSVWKLWDQYHLVDGFHRLSAHILVGHKTVPCQVVGNGSEEEAKEYALLANLHTNIPLSREQRIAVAAGVATLHPDWTIKKIAQTMSVTELTASRLLADATRTKESKSPVRREWIVLLSSIESLFARCLKTLTPVSQWTIEDCQRHSDRLQSIVKLYNEIQGRLAEVEK